jgi:hypothetical protein
VGARGISLPVNGVVLVDLRLDTDESGSAVIRGVKAFALPGTIIDDAKLCL